MSGCAVATIGLNLVQIWGPAAIPKEYGPNDEGHDHSPYYHDYLGAAGTTATCSMQGFLYQVFMLAVPLYYVALSLLSWWVVRNKFRRIDPKNQFFGGGIEKHIHIAVYAFPLCSAIYLLCVDAYNPVVRDCYVSNAPLGCIPTTGGEDPTTSSEFKYDLVFGFDDDDADTSESISSIHPNNRSSTNNGSF